MFYTAFCLLLASVGIGVAIFAVWGVFLLAPAFGLLETTPALLGLDSPHCLQFLSGVAVGAAAHHYRLRAKPTLLLWALGAVVAAVAFEVYGPLGQHTAVGRLTLGLASALLLATLVALENEGALRTPAWLARMGAVSYSIYLGHILFINITYRALLKAGLYHQLPEPLVLAMAILAALTATVLIGLYIELPLVKTLKAIGSAPAISTRAPSKSV